MPEEARGTPDAATEMAVVGKLNTGLLIGGSWREATGAGRIPVEDPSTGAILTNVADATPSDAVAALDAAVEAQASWASSAPRDRSEILRRAFQLLTERREEFALLMTLEMGKPLADSRSEIAYAAEFFRWFAEEAVRIDGRYATSPDGSSRLLVMRQAVGPCLLITPWNFPLAMGTRKIGPAIAAGCTMVCKPASLTPLSILALADLLNEAGLPDGVLNVVTTSKAGDVTRPLIADPRLRKLSFTGSTSVGRDLIKLSADHVLRVSMELGGNAPFLVFEDADLEAAVDGAVSAKMRNIGEACTAANRFYAHHSIADEFTAKLAARLGSMKVGRGTEDGVTVGPLVEAAQRDKVAELVDDAVAKGASVVTGGAPIEGAGYFFAPTVLTDISDSARLRREEIFGPVAPVMSFSTDDEVIAAANDTEYGLVSYVYTSGLDRAIRIAERLESGMIGLNQGMVSNPAAPFGGVKESGFGREGGREGISEYLETKYVALRTGW